VSHFMMPGSADTADGAAMFTGTTKEATINIAAKTPRILGNLVFIIPPDFVKPGKSCRAGIRPRIPLPGTPCKIFDLLAREFFRITFYRW
jgi:hypothetical protein